MNSKAEEIYQRLLDSGISEEELEHKIQKKAHEYSGFMSKQGILFLIAKEFGIEFNEPDTDSSIYEEIENGIDYDEFTIPIEKVRDGMVNIVLLAKILKLSPIRQFIRKDGSQGVVSSLIVGDKSGLIKVVIWNEKANAIRSKFFKEGEIIRILGDYSKTNKEGEIEVHISKRGKIILAPIDIDSITKQNLEKIKPMDIKSGKKFSQNQFMINVLISKYSFIKRIQGQVYIEEFKEITKKNGEKTFLLKFILQDDSGYVRVNIWGMTAAETLKIIEDGIHIRIINVIVKKNDFTNEKELVFTKASSIEVI